MSAPLYAAGLRKLKACLRAMPVGANEQLAHANPPRRPSPQAIGPHLACVQGMEREELAGLAAALLVARLALLNRGHVAAADRTLDAVVALHRSARWTAVEVGRIGQLQMTMTLDLFGRLGRVQAGPGEPAATA